MFRKVVIPVDVSVPDDTARLLAAAKALIAPWGSEAHVVTVVPIDGMALVGTYLGEDFEAQSRKGVSKTLAHAVAASGIEAEQHVMHGTIYDSVIELASTLDADLIVIGAHQPDLSDYLLGSNAARVVRHSSQSVLVMRDTAKAHH